MGAMVGPEAFTEVRYLAHHKQLRALKLIPELSALFSARFGRASGGLFRSYRATDAETIVVALGSVNGTVQEVVDEMRADGVRIGSVSITSFRPFPFELLGEALQHAKRVIVLEKCFAVGAGGIVSDDVRKALAGLAVRTFTVIAGLGGRPITRASLAALFVAAGNDALEPMTFLDLNTEVVARELAREKLARRSGPTAEAVLRQIGAAGPQVG
jgi:pyruvate ferredoxin oxidoreductase alpha subunit